MAICTSLMLDRQLPSSAAGALLGPQPETTLAPRHKKAINPARLCLTLVSIIGSQLTYKAHRPAHSMRCAGEFQTPRSAAPAMTGFVRWIC
jgi:hypothetical protein